MDEQKIWDAYNLLLCSTDIERMRKLLARYDLFKKTVTVPGDIVECGVFKGASLLMFLKFLAIHCNGSAKRVIGFDFFDGNTKQRVLDTLKGQEYEEMSRYFSESQFQGTTAETITDKAERIYSGKCELVHGDIRETALEYCLNRPGLRISLLHLDLDVKGATRSALEAFWPRIVKGGVVIFDEYAIPKWSESEGVDEFFANKDVRIQTLPWMRTPTAFLVKE